MDFTIITYKKLIDTLQKQGFSFISVEESVSKSRKECIILRHDVDSLPSNSLEFARIQADRGIKGTYYFRIVPESYDEKIIKGIFDLGHEIGYHYEDLSATAQRLKREKIKGKEHRAQPGMKFRQSKQSPENEEELVKIAIDSFRKNLDRMRQIVQVKTICMHGSPLSKWDSRLLWKYYDYHDFGIIGEPYFDINFDEVFYLTDTGRCWDGDSFNVRDKAQGAELRAQSSGRGENQTDPRSPITDYRSPFPKFHSTFDIIKAVESGHLPDRIMMTFHPQRWTDKPVPWVKELVWQNVKNGGKYFLKSVRSE